MDNPLAWTTLALGGFLSTGGCFPDEGLDAGTTLEIHSVPDTVIEVASGLIGALADVDVDARGSVYLLDRQSRSIHVVDSTGRFLRTIGRPGQGPGELGEPSSLRVMGDSVAVVDPGNGRVQFFTTGGEPSLSRAIPGCAAGALQQPSLGVDGTLAAPTLGFGTALAVVCDLEGEERPGIGDLLAPGQSVVDMREMRSQILRGEIPAMLLNAASVLVSPDGAIWLTLSAARRVERYGPTGARRFQLTLMEPEFEAVRAAWIERHVEGDLPGIAALNHILGSREVLGDLWILTNTAGAIGSKVVVVSNGGEVKRRLWFPPVEGAGDFAVDEGGGWVYFYIPETTELIRVAVNLGELVEPD